MLSQSASALGYPARRHGIPGATAARHVYHDISLLGGDSGLRRRLALSFAFSRFWAVRCNVALLAAGEALYCRTSTWTMSGLPTAPARRRRAAIGWLTVCGV